MKTKDFDYFLPESLIAQRPLEKRDASRLLFLDKNTGDIKHRRFSDLTELLLPGDLLVFNDSRVIPARLLGHKIPTGAAMEFLLLSPVGADSFEIIVRPGSKAKKGACFSFGDGLLTGEITEVLSSGNRIARFKYDGSFYEVLERVGNIPLPPYITEKLEDKERYQTVYSRERGSAAAPTAGLHFTDDTFSRLKSRGVKTAFVTLHVGLGTFRPVKAGSIEEHLMHSENYHISEEAAAAVNETKKSGGRIIPVGTTSLRTLESACCDGVIKPGLSSTDIFIYPGYNFKIADGLITNFHLPQSTLIMLVSALAGKEETLRAYSEAVREQYRFFSFGDAMIIL